MTLDISILNIDNRVIDFVPITVDQHWKLITLARSLGLQTIERLSDYYADASFSVDELVELESEIRTMISHHFDEMEILKQILSLIDQARSLGKGLKALAD